MIALLGVTRGTYLPYRLFQAYEARTFSKARTFNTQAILHLAHRASITSTPKWAPNAFRYPCIGSLYEAAGQSAEFHGQTDRTRCGEGLQKGDVPLGSDGGRACTYIGNDGKDTRGAEIEDLWQMTIADIIMLPNRWLPELRELVASFCPDSILWRYGATALHLTEYISAYMARICNNIDYLIYC